MAKDNCVKESNLDEIMPKNVFIKGVGNYHFTSQFYKGCVRLYLNSNIVFIIY